MGVLVFVLGRSGSGKSTSLKNFPPEKLALVNVQGKILPFRGGGKIKQYTEDDSEKICDLIETFSHGGYKSIVVDDYQYVMANEFMRRAYEKGYDKFMEIGRHAWDIATKVRELPQDVIVYILCHIEKSDSGDEKIKTIGRMLDEKICLEGMSTIVLKSDCTDGKYYFTTQNSGKDTVKTPDGMFPTYAIENDLFYVDNKIRNYYELGEFMQTVEEKPVEEVKKPEKKKRGSRPTPEKIVNAGMEDGREEVPFDEMEQPKPERKKREYSEVGDGFMNAPEGFPDEEEQPKKRRRRDV